MTHQEYVSLMIDPNYSSLVIECSSIEQRIILVDYFSRILTDLPVREEYCSDFEFLPIDWPYVYCCIEEDYDFEEKYYYFDLGSPHFEHDNKVSFEEFFGCVNAADEEIENLEEIL